MAKINTSYKVKGPVNLYANLLNVSPEGMRFFERKGILNPERNENTGYRMYGCDDGTVVIFTKKYRRYGFNINEVVNLVRQTCPKKLLEQFERQYNVLEDELEERKKVLASMGKKIDQLRHVRGQEGTYTMCQRPNFYFVPCRRNNAILDSEENIPYIKKCNNHQPHTDVGIVLTRGGDVEMGHIIEEEPARALGFDRAVYKPGAQCLYTVVSIQGSLSWCQYTLFDGMLAYMKENNYMQQGEAIARDVITTMDRQNQYHHVFQVWVPIA